MMVVQNRMKGVNVFDVRLSVPKISLSHMFIQIASKYIKPVVRFYLV